MQNDMFKRQYLLTKKINDENCIILMAICPQCGKKILLFNNLIDSYEYMNMHEKVTFNEYTCPKCNSNHFEVTMKYNYPDIQGLKKFPRHMNGFILLYHAHHVIKK